MYGNHEKCIEGVSHEEIAIFSIHLYLQEESDEK